MKVALVRPPLQGHFQRGTGKYFELLVSSISRFYSEKIQLFTVNYGDFNERDYDLVHYPYFDHFFLTLPLRFFKPTVITIHDLIPLRFSRFYPRGLRGEIKWQIQRRLLARAGVVLTDSVASQEDIVVFTNVKPNKIKVVYLAASEIFKPLKAGDSLLARVGEKFQLPRQFILYVGDVNYSKNVEGLIRAVKNLKQKGSGPQLLLVGRVFDKEEVLEINKLKELIKKLDLKKESRMIGFIPEDELAALYNLATVYCQPSFYEGFGLPVLEAMQAGCPVVHSGKGSLREVVEKAGIIVSPDAPDDIANGLKQVITDSQTQSKLKKRGLLQAQKFTLQKLARDTVSAYRSLAE